MSSSSLWATWATAKPKVVETPLVDNRLDWVENKYYFSDGSCVLLVGNEILKIHRSLLEKDSGFFRTMFSLPQSNQGDTSTSEKLPREGESDDNPITCHDTLADFKALCWGLYASPIEVSKELKWETVTIPKLIGLLAMAHKYEFNGLRDWSLDLLDTHSAYNPAVFLPRCGPWKNVGRLLTLSRQCGRSSLSGRIENEWMEYLSSKPLSIDTFNATLDVVEDLPELRQLQGKIYLEFLKGAGIFNASLGGITSSLVIGDSTSYVNNSIPTLNKSRLRRLYGGLWSLMQLRNQLLVMPEITARLDCTNILDHNHYESWWENTIEELRKNERNGIHDPFRICQVLQEQSVYLVSPNSKFHGTARDKHNTRYRVCDSCKSNVTARLQEISRKLEQSLPDHFNIPSDQSEKTAPQGIIKV